MAAVSSGVWGYLPNSLVVGRIQFLLGLNSLFNCCLWAGRYSQLRERPPSGACHVDASTGNSQHSYCSSVLVGVFALLLISLASFTSDLQVFFFFSFFFFNSSSDLVKPIKANLPFD